MSKDALTDVFRATLAREISCKNNTDILSPYKVRVANLLTNSFLFTQRADTKQH